MESHHHCYIIAHQNPVHLPLESSSPEQLPAPLRIAEKGKSHYNRVQVCASRLYQAWFSAETGGRFLLSGAGGRVEISHALL